MIYDLIIIGGGPAGITAGIYGARQKLKILLITKEFGGQVARKAVAIENYPGLEDISGLELIQKFEKQIRKQKVALERDEVTKVKKVREGFIVATKNKNEFKAKTIIVASGADPRLLEVPGEKEFLGRGLSYCVHCDGPLFSDKTVAVIGGGNSAFEAAISLSNIAKKIYILEYGEKIRADRTNQERVRKTKNVKIITDAAVKKIQGKQFVNSLVYGDKKSGKNIVLPVEGVFVEIGSQPATSFVKGLVDFNEKDEIIINPKTGQTKTSGFFAAGDVTNVMPKQIIVACGEGAKVALAAYDYLEKAKIKEQNAK